MKILAIGKNYATNLEDKNIGKDGHQIIFSKPASSLAVNCDVEYPNFTKILWYEIELVIKIGKEGKNISLENATSYISEIAAGIDYTAKDVFDASREQKGPWELSKGFDGAAPISSFKSISNFSNLEDINFDLKINGEQKQIGNTAFMIYNFAEIITFISKYMTLQPGDLIFTGTPATGAGEIQIGDRLQLSIEDELMLDFKMI
jgi:2-keto-4-pentenoate hydratase/2-oxohepta-3-ene-1,7-dioic acid hydratase in catechol pathway